MNRMTLKISDKVDFGQDAVTQTFGILGKKGSGKSNVAVVMAEEMYSAGIPWVCLDGKGDWWGVRAGKDGRPGSGLSVPIFGGEHADLPLQATAGGFVADLIASKRLSAVIDLSLFSKNELIRFCGEFADRLFRVNRQPLHLFCEEADQYIMQRVQHDEARCVGAFSKLVRLGRTHGLGVTLITQRSAIINKDVLTQVDTLIPMRTTSPQDRKAVEAWVHEHAAGEDLVSSLPSLSDGEGWIWSPHWLKELVRVKFRRRRTFDSGATPEMGKTTAAARLSDIDLGELSASMAKTVEEAKANDPAELRKRIKELEKQLTGKAVEKIAETKLVEVQVLKRSELDTAMDIANQMRDVGGRLVETATAMVQAIRRVNTTANNIPPIRTGRLAPSIPSIEPRPIFKGPDRKSDIHVDINPGMSNTRQKILDTVAMLKYRGLTPNRDMVARWMGIHPNGGRFGSDLAALRSGGYLEGCELTDQGRSRARTPETGWDAALKATESGTMRKILTTLRELRDNGTASTDRDTLAGLLGIHPNGGRFGSDLSWLRTMELITPRGPIALTSAADM